MENNEELLKIADLCSLTTLSKSTIYREIKKGTLPKPYHLTFGRVVWKKTELNDSDLIRKLNLCL